MGDILRTFYMWKNNIVNQPDQVNLGTEVETSIR